MVFEADGGVGSDLGKSRRMRQNDGPLAWKTAPRDLPARETEIIHRAAMIFSVARGNLVL